MPQYITFMAPLWSCTFIACVSVAEPITAALFAVCWSSAGCWACVWVCAVWKVGPDSDCIIVCPQEESLLHYTSSRALGVAKQRVLVPVLSCSGEGIDTMWYIQDIYEIVAWPDCFLFNTIAYFFSRSWFLAVHLWEMTNFMLCLCWVLTWVDYMSGTVRVFNDIMVSSTVDWFCTGSLRLSSSWGLDWAFQFGTTGLLHLCQRRAVFRPSHQIIHKAKTFSFGHGKWKILMGVIPLSVRLPCEAWGLRWMKLY